MWRLQNFSVYFGSLNAEVWTLIFSLNGTIDVWTVPLLPCQDGGEHVPCSSLVRDERKREDILIEWSSCQTTLTPISGKINALSFHLGPLAFILRSWELVGGFYSQWFVTLPNVFIFILFIYFVVKCHFLFSFYLSVHLLTKSIYICDKAKNCYKTSSHK